MKAAAAEQNERLTRLEMRLREREDQLREKQERIQRLEDKLADRDDDLKERDHAVELVETEVCTLQRGDTVRMIFICALLCAVEKHYVAYP